MTTMHDTYPHAGQVSDWWQDERRHATHVGFQRQPADPATLARVRDALLADREQIFQGVKAWARDTDYGTGPQAVMPPASPPDAGALRAMLTRMAKAAAAVRKPIFHASCWDCVRSGGWCPRHRQARDEHEFFTRLAARFATAVSDEDADFVLRATAAGTGLPVPADSGWAKAQNRAQNLLTEAEGNALPDSVGCCSDENPCPGHAAAIEVAEFVGSIRDAVIDAASAAEAARLITLVITGEK